MSFDLSPSLAHDMAGERSIEHVGIVAEDNTVLACKHFFSP
jgi:hypothetical protein